MSIALALPVHPSMTKTSSPLGLINLLKITSTQLIIFHHLAFYGPMSDYVRPLMPDVIGWLESYARIAVQVFLVIGGFLAAKSLSPRAAPGVPSLPGTILHRYIKLVPPYLIATLLAVGVSAWLGTWMTHDSISPIPDFSQLVAHAFLLHNILGYDSLWAGAWYIAIDFQLYAVMALLLWLAGRLSHQRNVSWIVPALVSLGICASLFYFNRDSDWDVWAPYFFGSYGLGIIAWWASDRQRKLSPRTILMIAIIMVTLAALMIDFRSRIAVALIVASVLACFGRYSLPRLDQPSSLINRLGRQSYSVFLVHFPVCLLVNGAFTLLLPTQPLVQVIGMLCASAASLIAGAIFYRWVELPLHRLTSPLDSYWRVSRTPSLRYS